MGIVRYALVLALIALVGGAAVATADDSDVRAAVTCDDYSNQRDAQENKDTRDADGDGIYCEALPCPCLKPGDRQPIQPVLPQPKPPTKRKKPRKRAQRIAARITSVVDGDTIKVRAFGAKRSHYTVRLIGIDTPETKKPGTSVECGGKEATSNMFGLAFTEPNDSDGDGLLDTRGGKGRRVTLTTDPTQDTYDRYRRLLAYVVTSTGTHLQVSQLGDGFARLYVFERRFRQYGRFRSAQSRAKRVKLGVWGECRGKFHVPASRRASRGRECGPRQGSLGVEFVYVEQGAVACPDAIAALAAFDQTGAPPTGWDCALGHGGDPWSASCGGPFDGNFASNPVFPNVVREYPSR